MVADSFVLDDLGLHDLKGIALPARVFAAVRERTGVEREAAAEATGRRCWWDATRNSRS